VVVGLVAALLAAVLFGGLAVVQAAAARRHGLLSPLMALVAALYLVGWLLHLVAIARLPLYLAQVGVAAALVVTALVAAYVMGEPLWRRHWLAVVGLVGGLSLLAVAAGDVGPSGVTAGTLAVLALCLVATAGMALVVVRSTGQLGGVLLGVLAGLADAGSPIATRALTTFRVDGLAVAAAVCTGLFGLLGFVLYSAALRRTSVTAATAPLTLLQTVIPAVVGLAFFGDGVRAGWWPAAAAAFAASVAAAVVLCGARTQLEVHHAETGWMER
jgi:drug/metabolite transporter (DMT)-like permease